LIIYGHIARLRDYRDYIVRLGRNISKVVSTRDYVPKHQPN